MTTTETISNRAMTLKKIEQDLLWVLPTSEQAVDALVRGFHALTASSESILQLAASIVDCVEGDQVVTVLPKVNTLGAVAKQYIASRLAATSGILDTVAGEVELLRQLVTVTDGQAKVAQRIRILNIHTLIEVAHLGKVGSGFEYLAKELADFSQALAKNNAELSDQTRERKAATENTRQMLSDELPNLRRQFARVEQNLEEELQALDSGIANLAATPAHFHITAQSLSEQIQGVVVAVQGHDITRQQIEHVCSSVGIIRQLLADNSEACDEAPPMALSGLAIQTAQLHAIRQSISAWTSQIGLCMDSIFKISASQLVGIGPQVEEQENALARQLDRIDKLEGECEACGGKIRETLDGISNLSQLVTNHIKRAETARTRLQLLTFNSIVEASRLGSEADTICVIADDIGAVSTEWNSLMERSNSALNGILRLSDEIGTAMSSFSEARGEQLQEAREQIKGALDGLREAAAFSVTQGGKIAALADAMRAKSQEIGRQSELLGSCFARIELDLAELERMKVEMEIDGLAMVDGSDKEEAAQLFSAGYTTEAERLILRAALFGETVQESEQSLAGNSVELF